MLAEALKKETKVKPEQALSVNPGAFYDQVVLECGDLIECVPYSKRWFGMLGKAMQDIQGFEPADVDRVCAWIRNGGLKGWPVKPTFAHLIKHLSTWVMKARATTQSTPATPLDNAFD